ncbi:hypothetical protein TrCOL_g4100 [Triparma columacea]|uniref:Smr domain-containing protein n=1 Tax=Triparma columacea TaxID=722753 RepID=A0A9W7FZF2_9STRA|nr:hypothetical protein TrCOL_g4100 [Triparma columacea]
MQDKQVRVPTSTSGYLVPSDSVDLSPSDVADLQSSLSSILSSPISSVSDSDRKKAFNLLRTLLLSNPTLPPTSTIRKVVKLFNRGNGTRVQPNVLVGNFQKTMSLIRLFDHSSVSTPSEVTDVVECYLEVMKGMKFSGRWKDCLNLVAFIEKEVVGVLVEEGWRGRGCGGKGKTTEEEAGVIFNRIYTSALAVLNHCGSVSQTMLFLERVLDPNTERPFAPPTPATTLGFFNLALTACSKKKQYRKALELITDMERRNISPDIVSYNSVISAAGRNGDEAVKAFRKISSKGLKPDLVSYNSVMAAVAGDKKEYRNTFTYMDMINLNPKVQPDVITYTCIIKAHATGGDAGKALRTLEVMKEKDVKPDAFVYASAINACAKDRTQGVGPRDGGTWATKALELIEEMEGRGIKPNGYAYASAITACGSVGEWEEGVGLLEVMRGKGMEIGLVAYNSAIGGIVKRMKGNLKRNDEGGEEENEELWKRAVMLLEEIKGEERIKPDAISYSTVLNALSLAGRSSETLAILSEMKSGPPSIRPGLIAYTSVISCMGRSGEWEVGMKVFGDMKREGINGDRTVYNAMLSALGRGDRPEMVLGIWEEMMGRKGGEGVVEAGVDRVSHYGGRISPDFISLTAALSTLERHENYREHSDGIFKDAVDLGVVWKGKLDADIWEVNLAGMPISVGSVAIRHAVHRCVEEILEGGGVITKDLVFITGVGKGGDKEDRLTLKDFTRVYLRDELGLRTVGREREGGVVVIEMGTLKEWYSKYGGEEQ